MAEISDDESDGFLNDLGSRIGPTTSIDGFVRAARLLTLKSTDGAVPRSFRYFFPAEYDVDDFEPFVHNVDDALLMTAAEAIQEFHRELMQVNSPHGIQADHSFAFRLLEYGRHRASTLHVWAFWMPSSGKRHLWTTERPRLGLPSNSEWRRPSIEYFTSTKTTSTPELRWRSGEKKDCQKPEKSDFAKEYGHDPASEKPQRSYERDPMLFRND